MEKEKRLRSNKDFKRVYKRGKRTWNHMFTIYFFKHKDSKHSRVGITVTKKLGNAVQRNKIKRRLKEIIRHHWTCIPGGYDVIIVPKPKTTKSSYIDLEKSLLHILSIAWKVKG